MLGVYFNINEVEKDLFKEIAPSENCNTMRHTINEYRAYYKVFEKWLPQKSDDKLPPNTKILKYWVDKEQPSK